MCTKCRCTDSIIQFRHQCRFLVLTLKMTNPACEIMFYFSLLYILFCFYSKQKSSTDFTLNEVGARPWGSGGTRGLKLKVHFWTHFSIVFHFLWKSNMAWRRNRSTRVFRVLCAEVPCATTKGVRKIPPGKHLNPVPYICKFTSWTECSSAALTAPTIVKYETIFVPEILYLNDMELNSRLCNPCFLGIFLLSSCCRQRPLLLAWAKERVLGVNG